MVVVVHARSRKGPWREQSGSFNTRGMEWGDQCATDMTHRIGLWHKTSQLGEEGSPLIGRVTAPTTPVDGLRPSTRGVDGLQPSTDCGRCVGWMASSQLPNVGDAWGGWPPANYRVWEMRGERDLGSYHSAA